MGRPRKTEPGQLAELFAEYCDDIAEQGFTVVPTKRNFRQWLEDFKDLKLSPRGIHLTLNRDEPERHEAKEIIKNLLADVLVEGAALKAYQTSIVIFALKNWCEWTDKTENKQNIEGGIKIQLSDEVASWAK